MRLSRLRIERLRCVDGFDLALADGWTAFIGANGAGKTSLLEAVYLLSHGRSFRATNRDSLSAIGSTGFAVHGEFTRPDGRVHRLGLGRVGGRLEARLDGADVTLGELVGACAVVCFEPGSHALIHGPAEERRSSLDWGVFHVEQGFLGDWRRYQRGLRQRNALLRSIESADELAAWEHEMAEAGERVTCSRTAYADRLRPLLIETLAGFVPELGSVVFEFERGWREGSLAGAFVESRPRDRERGHSTRGPHRADWSIAFEHAPRREHLSRGQEKLCALAFCLAQARLHAEHHGEWPVLCFDDLASELDREHQSRVIGLVRASGAQVLVTGTELPEALRSSVERLAVFHVEHGRLVDPLL
ncbi:MAG TPA: DNA replication/repair protein RecF [Dokdonella sp.]|uniref:DNA replication/repair protein RecF n=1 Tax=Dokdonella sp. TaxID=2291710 RepID=UPI0025BDE28A|nr:DNA replication/repair protein RecF [Dokdonella sp.]MBX3691337.1 DNA replication/repair protein RecF [Dokdonella sp.]MCW5568508.1 DNA replication/repair protein RecF [Dokdonella sp.]HNR90832.1 DNA replication/repair protein RecF [Dokdonella sp.]